MDKSRLFDEYKHLVLKWADLNASLTEEEKIWLEVIIHKNQLYRISQGKNSTNKYIVVNCDEPYAEQILNIVERAEFYKKY
jgi:hypothetical protein